MHPNIIVIEVDQSAIMHPNIMLLRSIEWCHNSSEYNVIEDDRNAIVYQYIMLLTSIEMAQCIRILCY